MKECEQSGSSAGVQKEKIRSRYQGIDPDLLVVIPAKTEAGLYDDNIHRRVAVYVRVSTDDRIRHHHMSFRKIIMKIMLNDILTGTW